VCWAYTHLVGHDVTTARALVVIVIYGLAKLLGRVGSDLRTFLLSALAVVLLWPGCFFEIGFHLTFAALWGLMLASRLLSPLREGLLTQWVVKPLMQSVGASLCTAPVLLCWFNTLVPLSPLINLIAGPYFTAVCILGGGATLAALVLDLPFSAELLGLNCELTEWFLEALERGNGALVAIGLGMKTFAPLAAWSLAAVITGIVFMLSLRAWGSLPQNQNNSTEDESADNQPFAKVSLVK
jgi:competence protein ComEC